MEIQFHLGSFAVPQNEVHCRCTQMFFKSPQLQYKIGSDLSSFIISLGNQGGTNPKHPRLSPLCVTDSMSGSEDRTIPPVPVSPTCYFTSPRSCKAGRAELGRTSMTAQEPLPPLFHALRHRFPEPGEGQGSPAWPGYKKPLQLQPPERRTETASSQSSLLPDIKQLLILALLFCNPT